MKELKLRLLKAAASEATQHAVSRHSRALREIAFKAVDTAVEDATPMLATTNDLYSPYVNPSTRLQ